MAENKTKTASAPKPSNKKTLKGSKKMGTSKLMFQI